LAANQNPVIGAWYVDCDGRFLRVWGSVYQNEELHQVVIQQLNGKRKAIDIGRWRCLDLVRYPAVAQRNSGVPFCERSE
jgi:hypothetical protein